MASCVWSRLTSGWGASEESSSAPASRPDDDGEASARGVLIEVTSCPGRRRARGGGKKGGRWQLAFPPGVFRAWVRIFRAPRAGNRPAMAVLGTNTWNDFILMRLLRRSTVTASTGQRCLARPPSPPPRHVGRGGAEPFAVQSPPNSPPSPRSMFSTGLGAPPTVTVAAAGTASTRLATTTDETSPAASSRSSSLGAS